MLSFFKCKKVKQPVTIKPIKSSYSDSGGRIELSAPTGDSTPIAIGRGQRVSFANTEPSRSSFKKNSVDCKGEKKPSVTWDDEGYDHSIDLSNQGSSKAVNRRVSSGVSKEIINEDDRIYITNGVGGRAIGNECNKNSSSTKGTKSSTKSSNSNNDKVTKGDNTVIIYGNDKVNKLPKGKVEPMRINSQLNNIKELYNENIANEEQEGSTSNWLSRKFSSKRLDKGVKDCTLIVNSDNYGRDKYFNRDKKGNPSIFKKMESHEEYIEERKKSSKTGSKKISFFNSSLIDNCFPMYNHVRNTKDDDDYCDVNLSSNYMNAKNKILHREHSAGTGFFNNRLSSLGCDKGYVDGRGPGCASMSTNPVSNPTIIRKRRNATSFQRTVSKGDKFCVNSDMIDGSDESSIIYRLSKGISGLQTSTYVLPERPFLKRNSLDYTRDSKLYYIKVKAAHEKREKERQMKEREGTGYYNGNGEFVDIVPPPYLTKDSSCEDVVESLGFWEKCCPR
ncbi:hypothetical protein BMR1_03g01730 [Babesia microti strain RI]|uniref:Uncharacterized protein n=1 Tax=Babesia microti (strain RI) TaxID=1133968 RepID=A0A0K3AR71_BABMR|nr:hypothetical protein BMR1_03g01730 [Babesia microti strain RI]CTQ40945.1 hypothetical protein BMR1_03g01730 [Babesia microti strain RI]|eukprot:XP_012648956.1 hypothetical protein BMR1_03g01730 [Babesia microti strain RI]